MDPGSQHRCIERSDNSYTATRTVQYKGHDVFVKVGVNDLDAMTDPIAHDALNAAALKHLDPQGTWYVSMDAVRKCTVGWGDTFTILDDRSSETKFIALGYRDVSETPRKVLTVKHMKDMFRVMMQNWIHLSSMTGMTHNDLHPGNLMWDTRADCLKVIDYGRLAFQKVPHSGYDGAKLLPRETYKNLVGKFAVDERRLCTSHGKWSPFKLADSSGWCSNMYWIADLVTLTLSLFDKFEQLNIYGQDGVVKFLQDAKDVRFKDGKDMNAALLALDPAYAFMFPGMAFLAILHFERRVRYGNKDVSYQILNDNGTVTFECGDLICSMVRRFVLHRRYGALLRNAFNLSGIKTNFNGGLISRLFGPPRAKTGGGLEDDVSEDDVSEVEYANELDPEQFEYDFDADLVEQTDGPEYDGSDDFDEEDFDSLSDSLDNPINAVDVTDMFATTLVDAYARKFGDTVEETDTVDTKVESSYETETYTDIRVMYDDAVAIIAEMGTSDSLSGKVASIIEKTKVLLIMFGPVHHDRRVEKVCRSVRKTFVGRSQVTIEEFLGAFFTVSTDMSVLPECCKALISTTLSGTSVLEKLVGQTLGHASDPVIFPYAGTLIAATAFSAACVHSGNVDAFCDPYAALLTTSHGVVVLACLSNMGDVDLPDEDIETSIQMHSTLPQETHAMACRLYTESVALLSSPRDMTGGGARGVKLISIVGLGCIGQNLGVVADMYASCGIPRYNMDILCDPSWASTIGKITSACTTYVTGPTGSWIKEWARRLRLYLMNSKVILVGHSFGGMLSVMLTKVMLDANIDITHLHVQTIASIYVPDAKRFAGVDLTHVMMMGDIATKCNGLNTNQGWELLKNKPYGQPATVDNYVYWIRSRASDKVSNGRPLDIGAQFGVHNDDHYIAAQNAFISGHAVSDRLPPLRNTRRNRGGGRIESPKLDIDVSLDAGLDASLDTNLSGGKVVQVSGSVLLLMATMGMAFLPR